jgi:quercetin dioxygenase-like cupin family protein
MFDRYALRRVLVATALIASMPCVALAQTAPTIPSTSAPPAAGIQPTVSAHIGAAPVLYELDAQPIEQISPLIQRQYLVGAQSTFVKWTVKKGAVFPLHHHAYEQITWITKGRCEVSSQGRKFVMTEGTVLVIPPNVPHEFLCTEDTIDIDFFAPQRQDWIDGAPSIAATK